MSVNAVSFLDLKAINARERDALIAAFTRVLDSMVDSEHEPTAAHLSDRSQQLPYILDP